MAKPTWLHSNVKIKVGAVLVIAQGRWEDSHIERMMVFTVLFRR